MPDFNFEDLLNQFNTDQKKSPTQRLANEWTSVADNAAKLSDRCTKLLEQLNGDN